MNRPRPSLYRRIVPFGSRRERILWIATVTVRKMREGPGPWLRAVRKGLYQLLPVRWQQQMLRWTGEAQFFRRDTVRHVGDAAGIERPGHVSVVLPVYNQADMVAEAIESVLAQSHASLELIIVDDGSSDGLHEAVCPYLDDPRVRFVTQQNQGLPKALSTGFDLADGEFFTWTSADNRMHRDQLLRLVAFLQARPAVAHVYADYELIDADGEPLAGGEFRVMDRTDKSNLAAVRVHRSTHDLNRYEDNFIGACFLYRGQVGRLLGDYNPELGLEDYDYWMRINRLFRIEHIGTDEVLYQYRVHDNTLSARARELRIAERAKALMRYERDRARWYDAPFTIFCTAEEDETAWIDASLPDGDKIVRHDQAQRAEGAAEHAGKRLTVWSSAQLSAADRASPDSSASGAAWFATAEQVHLAHDALRHEPLVAFADDQETLARLAVYTRTAFRGAKTAESLEVALRFASNSSFSRRTMDAQRMRRAAPMPVSVPGEEQLRVLLQLDTCGTGGLERVAFDLAESWLEQGCEVGLLTLDGSGAPLPEGVERVRLSSRDEVGYARALAEGRWHVVSAHASTFGVAAAAAAGVPFVQVVHNSYVWLDRAQIETYRDADADTAAYACVSAQALGYADLRLNLDVTKMLVVENGIAPAPAPSADVRCSLRRELGLRDDDFVFLQVASLQPAKGHRHAVHALARLRARHAHAKLVCLGSDMNPLHAATVRADIQRLGLQDDVIFAGHRADVAPFYAMADAFFLPSFWEGCSLALLEAMRAGLPLVVSDVGAAREQLRAYTGYGRLVPPPFPSMFAVDAGNVDALVNAVDPAFVEALAEALGSAIEQTRSEPHLPQAAQRRTMAARHLMLLRWLRQGGRVATLRETVARAGSAALGADPGPAGP